MIVGRVHLVLELRLPIQEGKKEEKKMLTRVGFYETLETDMIFMLIRVTNRTHADHSSRIQRPLRVQA